eukprot:Tamp_07943.p1 GENE.Tamp_07943~~Tamp_07943.p1  ORF type:complete len:455 (-),score=89.45 Tamp_07943:1046-2353(-)
MAASHIALRARSYGSFPASADAHDVAWLQHSQERIAGRRSLDDRRTIAQAWPCFLDAFPVLRDASQHLRTLFMGAAVTKQFVCGETLSDDKEPALVYVLAGEAEFQDEGARRVRPGQGAGEEILWHAASPTLKATSRTGTALVIRKSELDVLRQAVPEHYAEFEKQIQLHRAWHKEGDGGMAIEEVHDLVRCLVDAARRDDSVTIRKVARDRPALLDLCDHSAREGGALHVAAMSRSDSAFDTLLELDASPDARSSSGHTPMHSAALVGNLTAIRKLLERQASASKSSNMLRTPLHFAAQEGHVDVVKALLKAGAKVDVQDTRLSTPAHLAVRHGHPDVVKALLLAGCNILKRDHHRRSVWNEARQWKDGDADGLGRQERGAIYDMVHLVFTREKLLTDWGHPCPERDRSYLEMPAPEPEPEPEPAPKKPNFNLV